MNEALHAWFRDDGRSLAFRETSDPYAVLVSEVMLQQTQVSRVEPAWQAFMSRFPSVRSLADATTGDVVKAWAGLGYNRRAVNLHRTARALLERHAATVPDDRAALEALPGVGGYTARAVSAIAFGRPLAAVDTNVRRVVGRLVSHHGVAVDGASPLRAAALQTAADRLVDRARSRDWTYAVMDLGSSICRPIPRCAECPLPRWCAYGRATAPPRPPQAPGGDADAVHPVAMTSARPRPERPSSARVTARTRSPGAFPSTRRWLRGRLVARLREAPPGRWMVITAPVGVHDEAAVEAALTGLVADGLVERAPDGRVRLPC